MMDRTPLVLSLLLALVCCAYYVYENDLILLLIPAISLISLRFAWPAFKKHLAVFFLVSFLCAAILLYLASELYIVFGVLSFTFFSTLTAISFYETYRTG